MRRLAIHSSLFLSFSVLATMGCSQDEGERCQQDSDCASGLVCTNANQGSGYMENGSCTRAGSTSSGNRDAGTTNTSKMDANPRVDGKTTDGLSSVDTGAPADGGPDAGIPDASIMTDGSSQPRSDARLDSSLRTDADVDAPAADAPVDTASPIDAATDGQLG